MPSCHQMKLGQVYVCEECGLELKVVKACKSAVKKNARLLIARFSAAAKR